jgi:hypothetical protein
MATDSLQPQAVAAALLDHGDVLNALLDIKGAVRLSRQAVYDTMNEATLRADPTESAAILSSTDGVLTLAENAIERLYEQLAVMSEAWPVAAEGVANV